MTPERRAQDRSDATQELLIGLAVSLVYIATLPPAADRLQSWGW
jgi:hypothetical protein